jgi:hypothetical protein
MFPLETNVGELVSLGLDNFEFKIFGKFLPHDMTRSLYQYFNSIASVKIIENFKSIISKTFSGFFINFVLKV